MKRRHLLALLGGAASVRPLTAAAQQKAMPVIGYLSVGPPTTRSLPALQKGLSEEGYIDGRNVAIEYRWAEDRYDRLPGLAADLVGRNVDVIVTSGGPLPALAAKNATSTIPIVFVVGGDPVAAGLATSMARPSGNLTGFTIQVNELMPKRLQ